MLTTERMKCSLWMPMSNAGKQFRVAESLFRMVGVR